MKAKRILTIGTIAVSTLAVGAALAFHFATQALQSRVQGALGPNSQVDDVIVHWSTIEMRGVTVRSPAGWPARDTLRAERIVVTPDLRSLFSAQLHVRKVDVEKPYVSILRSRDGHVHLLPGLFKDKSSDEPPSARDQSADEVGTVMVHDGTVDFFDASIRQPAHLVKLGEIEARLGGIHIPTQSGHIQVKLDGVVKGVQGNGKVAIDGWLDPVTLDSDITTTLTGVDVIALQPYLVKATETGIKAGKLDMSLRSRVQGRYLNAPGSITLTGLELDSGDNPLATFMGVPRRAVIASLKDKGDRIVVPFTLAGNLDDPHFSLNENLASHLGGAVAGVLGISVEGLAHGVGSAAEGVQDAVKKLFGK